MDETCECSDCIESDTPCEGDCSEELCEGCYWESEASKDREHDEMCALGYK